MAALAIAEGDLSADDADVDADSDVNAAAAADADADPGDPPNDGEKDVGGDAAMVDVDTSGADVVGVADFLYNVCDAVRNAQSGSSASMMSAWHVENTKPLIPNRLIKWRTLATIFCAALRSTATQYRSETTSI
jgi:hypothetical protein